MAYDKLVISVGAFSATFGTEGVSFKLSSAAGDPSGAASDEF